MISVQAADSECCLQTGLLGASSAAEGVGAGGDGALACEGPGTRRSAVGIRVVSRLTRSKERQKAGWPFSWLAATAATADGLRASAFGITRKSTERKAIWHAQEAAKRAKTVRRRSV